MLVVNLNQLAVSHFADQSGRYRQLVNSALINSLRATRREH